MVKLSDIREKEVININDGTKLGYVYDFQLDLTKGKVTAIIIPGPGKILGMFGRTNDLIIKWSKIIKLGKDAILVDYAIGDINILDK